MDLGSALKKTIPNPNRRSIHYVKQSPFEGSDRNIRGIILRMLLAEPGIREEKLQLIRKDDPARITRILSVLEHEGFIHKNNDRIFLYDVNKSY
jgi:A/G-specific adenine glycosylase